MKIVNSINQLYEEKLTLYKILESNVNGIINPSKNKEWHYISRIKKIESFALKFESGRFNKESIFEDFFACTLVVQNLDQIHNAVDFISERFDITSRRPKNDDFTHKDSYSFAFDDLRIYAKYRDIGTKDLAPEILDLVFEIQIKTFLQHAWAIATHDLIYKSDSINWGKERVAYQVKAALEHAEVTISGVEYLSSVAELSKSNKNCNNINETISFLKETFPNESLPQDCKRLAENINKLCTCLKLDITKIREYLNTETENQRGVNTLNLSPFQIILQSTINLNPDCIVTYLNNKKKSDYTIVITPEMNVPIKIRDIHSPKLLLIT